MATTYSTQMTNHRATPRVINEAGGYESVVNWDYTVATTALANNDIVELCRVPAGCKVLMPKSVMKVSATTGASTTIDIGYAAYKKNDGTTAAASADALVNGYVSSSTAVNSLIPATQAPVGTGCNNLGVMDFTDAVEDVIIQATCLDSGGTFDGDIADVWDGYFTVQMGGK